MTEHGAPIVACLALLHEQWTRFVRNAGARLLVWRATDEEAPFIDAFVARECESEAAETPDLFVQLSAPFTSEAGHGDQLARELAGLLAEALPSSDARAPRARAHGDDIAGLLHALRSLRCQLTGETCPAVLTVWLTPDAVSSWHAYLLWLQRLLQGAEAQLRFLVVERACDPRYAPLAESAPERVVAQSCALSVFNAIEQLAIQADRGSPDGQFRTLQAQLAARLGEGDLAGAARTGEAALALANQHGWPQLAAAVQMMLAAAYSAADSPSAAIAAYAEAERMGALAEAHEADEAHKPADAQSDPRGRVSTGLRIRLHACLGQAAVWLASRAYQGAAVAYQRSAHLAHALHDACAELDAYRMASVCHSALADADAAWQCAMHGLRVGLAMDTATRRHSTLAYLTQHALSLTERHRAYRDHRSPLETQLTALLQPAVPNSRSGKGVSDE